MADPPPRLAVVPILAPEAPRLTHLTREFVNRVMELCRDYYRVQSGGRANWTFNVFDWYRIKVQDLSQAEFDAMDQPQVPGEKRGDLLLPLLQRDLGLNVSQFTHFAWILDHPNVGGGGAWFPQTSLPRKYLNYGAPDLNPSLLAHELGHMFELGHTYLDMFPRTPLEYEDLFCVMGYRYSYRKERDQANKLISFRTDFGDRDWYWCARCAGAYRARSTDVGLCPGSPTGHRAGSGEFNPRREPPSAASDEEAGWRLCGKCGAMFFDGAADKGHCAAGGEHQAAGAGVAMVLRHGTTPIERCESGGWQQCSKCRALYRVGDGATSSCPVAIPTSAHEPISGGRSYVLPFDGDHNEWGPGLCAPMLSAAGWLDPAHGVDIGARLHNRPGMIEVELAPLAGSPAPGPVAAPVYTFANNLATEPIFIEFRSKRGDDAGLPESSPRRSDWVLVRLLLGKSTRLLAAISAEAGAASYVRYADLYVRVMDKTSTSDRVKLRITSGGGWLRRALSSKTTLNELSEGGPAIASRTSVVALAWTGTDDRLNAAVSFDGGRTFAPKFRPVHKSDYAPTLTGGDLYIGWTGTDDRLNMGELFSVFAFGQPATLPETSDAGPALARDRHGTLFLAWTGENDLLNIIMSIDDGYTWVDKRTFNVMRAHGRPALVADPDLDRMFLAWRTGERLFWADVGMKKNEAIPEGNPGRCVVDDLGPVQSTNELSDHSPALMAFDHGVYLGWTGTNETLNLYGPMSSHTLPSKRVFDPEISEDEIALTVRTGRDKAMVLAWTGADEKLNVATMELASRRRALDDFKSGAWEMVVPANSTKISVQTGSMIGGSRRVRIDNHHASEHLSALLFPSFHTGLELRLLANHSAALELAYGPVDGSTAPALGLDLRQAGADRLRVNVFELRGIAVNIDASLITGSRISTATVLAGRAGPVDFFFTGFNPDQLSHVDQLIFDFKVFKSTGEWPALTIDSIETCGPMDD